MNVNVKRGNDGKFKQVIKFRVVGGEMGATSSLAPKVAILQIA